jgi:hypothetical protein
MPIYAAKISQTAPSVVYGIALVLVMLVLPGGLGGLVERGFGAARTRFGRGKVWADS